MSKNKQMTLEEMEAKIISLGEQRNAIIQEMRALRADIDQRLAEQTAREKLARMSDVERAALAQIIAPDGFGFKVEPGNR